MNLSSFLSSWGDAAFTSVGIFWKAAWAFILGYAISAMIQAFVPKTKLTRHMGDASPRSVAADRTRSAFLRRIATSIKAVPAGSAGIMPAALG